jgi:hypothetical protein
VHYPLTAGEYRALSEALPPELVNAVNVLDSEMIGADIFDTLFQPAVEAAKKNDAPLYCGEYGVIDQAPAEDALRWLKDIHSVFEKYGIGRSLWNYKEKDFGLIDDHYAAVRKEMERYL